MDRSKWPLSRDFRDCVPMSELRSRHEVTKQVNSLGVMISTSMELMKKLVGIEEA